MPQALRGSCTALAGHTKLADPPGDEKTRSRSIFAKKHGNTKIMETRKSWTRIHRHTTKINHDDTSGSTRQLYSSQKTCSSRTLRAMRWLYWDPKSRMATWAVEAVVATATAAVVAIIRALPVPVAVRMNNSSSSSETRQTY